MRDEKLVNPKQRILKTASRLFAHKGYGVVGIREIAREANVNISMISYYFDGKMGILKAILSDFFAKYVAILEETINENRSPEECLRETVRQIVYLIKENEQAALVLFAQMPLDAPEITEMKLEKIKIIFNYYSGLFHRFGVDPQKHPQTMAIIGPAFVSMAFSNFLIKPLSSRLFPVEYDDDFYEHYCDILSGFMINNIKRLRKILDKGVH